MFGKAVNNLNVLANTVLYFMIVNLFGGPKFLYKMLPVRNLNADFLFNQANSILSSIRSVGGNVVAIICDGNRVNQAFFFTKFESISPWRTKEGVFLLFDFVHLLKNIRNNWITEKTQEIEFSMNGENKVAKWSDIKTLYKLESESNGHGLTKMSKLTDVSVYPKPIERQKVSAVLQVFCEETCSALNVHTDPLLQDTGGTVDFISMFLQFWKIVNVGNQLDNCKRDPNRAVIRSADDDNLHNLLQISNVVDSIAHKTGVRIKGLTKGTAFPYM